MNLPIISTKNEGTKNHVFCRKLIATTDKSLSLPLIPQSFIQLFVEKQGKIDKVRVDMSEIGKYEIGAFQEVIILPIQEKMYSREEVKAIAMETWRIGRQEPEIFQKDYGFSKWFDTNYPV